jgi:hypothetical protein
VYKTSLSTFNTGWTIANREVSILIIFVFISINLIHSCGVDIEDPIPPSQPSWFEKSLPEEWPERGIDAIESGHIYIEWVPNQQNEIIEKYQIFRAEYSELDEVFGEYELLHEIDAHHSLKTEYIDLTTIHNIFYSYKLIAVNDVGDKSKASVSVIYKRLRSLSIEYMLPNSMNVSLGSNRQLKWRNVNYDMMERYTLSITSRANMLLFRQEIGVGNYTGNTEYFYIPDSVVFSPGEIYKWRVDMSALYIDSRETAGSESLWAYFLFQPENNQR